MLLCYAFSGFKTFAYTVPSIQTASVALYFSARSPIFFQLLFKFSKLPGWVLLSSCTIRSAFMVFLIGIDETIIWDLLHLILETINSVMIEVHVYFVPHQTTKQNSAFRTWYRYKVQCLSLQSLPSPRGQHSLYILVLCFMNRMIAKDLEHLNK